MEVLEKTYWMFLDILMYVILGLLFFLILGATFIKTMIDKYIIKFLEFCDNTVAKISNFFNKKKK
jgi:hypothetical protein|tara:strand:+ start:5025 stop:5219 length:195 start_codon:yes stop_codon:yes gene_type:complete